MTLLRSENVALKSFDLISDLHLDFYVREYRSWDNSISPSDETIVRAFVESIIPDEPSPVLVIAGDLGHKNSQSIMLLKCLAETYEHVLFCAGNHDFYLFPSEDEHVIHSQSIERWQELKQMASSISGVTVLDGNTIYIGGYKFGGTSSWYDYSYGLKLGRSRKQLEAYWYSNFSDSKYITECPDILEELKKLRYLFDEHCDVIVTHVSPDDTRVNPRHVLDPLTSFYYFDGTEFLTRAKNKIWVFGHVHYRQMYKKDGCLFVNNALGYPGQLPFVKAMTVPLSELDEIYDFTLLSHNDVGYVSDEE